MALAISCHLFAQRYWGNRVLMLDACFNLFVPAPVSRMWQGCTAGAADERMTLSPGIGDAVSSARDVIRHAENNTDAMSEERPS